MSEIAVLLAFIYYFLQARGTMKRKEVQKILTHHLYFCMRDFGHHVGEDTEIYFSLYDTKKAKYIR
jgi:dedicator of cytokinesis protein 3